MHLKILSVKWQPFCPGGDELSICNHLSITSKSVACIVIQMILPKYAIICSTRGHERTVCAVWFVMVLWKLIRIAGKMLDVIIM